MDKMPKVKIYTLSTCPWCIKTKAFLTEHNIKFENIDVGKNREAVKEMEEKSGQIGVPVIDIDGDIIVGYEVEKLKKKLNIKD